MPDKTLYDYVSEINRLCDKHNGSGEPGSYELITYPFRGNQCFSLHIWDEYGEGTTSCIMNLLRDEMRLYLIGMIDITKKHTP